jgi:predicted  nucleic acid-binding Zn-ribbon protein
MYVTGIDECYLVAKVGNSLVEHLITADPEIQEKMRACVDKFWNVNILQDEMPDFRWSDADRLRDNIEGIDSGLSEVRDDLIPLIQEYAKVDEIYQQAKKMCDGAENAKKIAGATILGVIGDSKARVIKAGNNSITRWMKNSVSTDTKTLEKKYPQAYAECVKISASGRYKINVTKIITLQEN